MASMIGAMEHRAQEANKMSSLRFVIWVVVGVIFLVCFVIHEFESMTWAAINTTLLFIFLMMTITPEKLVKEVKQ